MAGLAFVNGNLLTQDPERPRADALAVEGGRIVAVGSRADVEPAVRPGTRTVDLEGRTLVPGFNDAHAHAWKLGQLLTGVLDVRRSDSLASLQESLRAFAARRPGGAWVEARGYNEAHMKERRHPTRADLDAAVGDRPVFLTRVCGHAAVANSRALEMAGVQAATAPPPGGRIERDADGRPTGLLYETAMGLVSAHVPPPTAAEHGDMVRAFGRHQLARGITSSSDCGVRPDLLAAYRDMDARGELTQRLNVMPLCRLDGSAVDLPLPGRSLSDHLRVDTAKLLADGGLSSATAALRESYRHARTRGVHRFEEEELRELMRETHAAGWRLAVHAIGDDAIERVLSAYELLGPEVARRRHRIEHLGLPDADQLRRAGRLGIVAAPQTVFIHSLGLNFREYLPERLLARAYPVREMMEAGIPVALSSDAPVVDEDSPLLGMQAAVRRRDADGHAIAADQAITAAQALRAYTMGGAFATGDEANRGSLSPGKWADLAVLSDDPVAADPETLGAIRVDMTVVGGKIVFER
jgi:predicted amidohydrolase YtcJ